MKVTRRGFLKGTTGVATGAVIGTSLSQQQSRVPRIRAIAGKLMTPNGLTQLQSGGVVATQRPEPPVPTLAEYLDQIGPGPHSRLTPSQAYRILTGRDIFTGGFRDVAQAHLRSPMLITDPDRKLALTETYRKALHQVATEAARYDAWRDMQRGLSDKLSEDEIREMARRSGLLPKQST